MNCARKWSALALTAIITAALLCEKSDASVAQKLTLVGRVKNLNRGTIRVENDATTLTLDRSVINPARIPRKLSEGDLVRIKYSLQVQDIEIMQNRHGEPGQVPAEKMILDDRAFYPA